MAQFLYSAISHCHIPNIKVVGSVLLEKRIFIYLYVAMATRIPVRSAHKQYVIYPILLPSDDDVCNLI